jgi:hypothetical protein
MTRQVDDLAAQQSKDGWTMAWMPEGGGSRIHLLDDKENILRSFVLASSLPDFSRFAHWTTAGMWWSQQMLAYFTTGQRHFVVRSWWGARLVIALDQLQPIDPQTVSDELHRTECELVLRGLQQLVTETENGEQPQYDGPSTDVLRCTVDTLVHFPGLLGLVEAIPLLRVLEERLGETGQCFSSFNYYQHENRRLAQSSLRRLGEKPRGYPALTFSEYEKRLPLRQPQPGPIDGPTRHANLSQIRRSTPITEVYQLLGAPDEVRNNFWRYDVDADPPCTVLLWLAPDDTVTRIVKYLPPWWTGPDVHDFHNGTFVGIRIEVDVLQEFASSERYPLAPLARAILDGTHDAIGPLADALEEAGDARAPQVRGWINAATRT